MASWFEILGLTHYAYLALAFVIALAAALMARRFFLHTLILGGVVLVIGCSGLLCVFCGREILRFTAEQTAMYFGRTALFGGGILAGVLARYSFAAFFSRLNTLSKLTPNHRRASGDPVPKNDLIEGVAFACLLSVFCGLALVGREMKPAILYWLVYAIACGVSISMPGRARLLTPEGLKNVLVVSVPPAVLLFLIILFQFLAPQLWHIGVLSVASFTDAESAALELSSAWKILWFYVVIGLATVVAIAIAVIARTRVVNLITQLFTLDPDRFSRVEKVLNSAMRIGATLGGIFIVAKST